MNTDYISRIKYRRTQFGRTAEHIILEGLGLSFVPLTRNISPGYWYERRKVDLVCSGVYTTYPAVLSRISTSEQIYVEVS